MTERLFVYGTLAPGRPNEHVLAGVPGTWEPATIRGRLIEHGWGAEIGFPAIVLDEEAPEVHGMLFSSEELDEHWANLDDFEGDGYERLLTSVTLESGETAVAHVYAVRGLSAAGC
ncbi:MAG TPA: gamma-glutamylcyclotransferase family protein [Marmoricola sp.]|nr:gamma-glutamylcyclotransferase family protein [Marmoricola sp.]